MTNEVYVAGIKAVFAAHRESNSDTPVPGDVVDCGPLGMLIIGQAVSAHKGCIMLAPVLADIPPRADVTKTYKPRVRIYSPIRVHVRTCDLVPGGAWTLGFHGIRRPDCMFTMPVRRWNFSERVKPASGGIFFKGSKISFM